MIFPITFRRLQPSIGFPWSTRINAFMILGTMCVSLAVMKTRTEPPKKARALLDWTALKEAPYDTFTRSVRYVGRNLFPLLYAPIQGQRIFGLSSGVSFYLLPVLNTGSFVGRIIPVLIADRLGPHDVMVPCALATTIVALMWLGISNAPGQWIFCVLYNFLLRGSYISTTYRRHSIPSNMSLIGTRMGTNFKCAAFGLLIRDLITGKSGIIDRAYVQK